MRTNLFNNSRNALIFAGAIVFGTVMLVDSRDGDDAISANVGSAQAATPAKRDDWTTRSNGSTSSGRALLRHRDGSKVEGTFGSDYSLMDEAEGEDMGPTDRSTESGSEPALDDENLGNSQAQPPGIDDPPGF